MNQAMETYVPKGIDEKFCSECGNIIKIKAEICPKCGVRQKNTGEVSKVVLLLLTFFTGGIGGHKFYLGKYWQGFFYLILFWTGIPGLIALIEFIYYACTPSDVLNEKYESKGGAGVVIAIVAGGFFVIAMIGILAAIAIPNFIAYRDRAFQFAVESELEVLANAEKGYFTQNGHYSSDFEAINYFKINPDVTIEITSADSNCFHAVGTHNQLPDAIAIDCNSY